MNIKAIRSYLLAGLVVWVPILITIWVLDFIISLLDSIFKLFPKAYQPAHLIGMNIPGLGVMLSLLLLLFTGIFATNFFGQRMVSWGETLLAKIPLVRSIYSAVKHVMNTLLSSNSEAFRKVLLVEYPRKGLWSFGFQTGSASAEVREHVQEEMVSIYIPTTPNPTSGFLIMLPKKEVIELNMSIDEALKCVISLGVMQTKAAVNNEAQLK